MALGAAASPQGRFCRCSWGWCPRGLPSPDSRLTDMLTRTVCDDCHTGNEGAHLRESDDNCDTGTVPGPGLSLLLNVPVAHSAVAVLVVS